MSFYTLHRNERAPSPFPARARLGQVRQNAVRTASTVTVNSADADDTSSHTTHHAQRAPSPAPSEERRNGAGTNTGNTPTTSRSLTLCDDTASINSEATLVVDPEITSAALEQLDTVDAGMRLHKWFGNILRETGTETGVGNGNRYNVCAYNGRKRAWCTCGRARRWVYCEKLDKVHLRMEAAWESGRCLDEARGLFDATLFEQDDGDQIEVWDGVVRGTRQKKENMN